MPKALVSKCQVASELARCQGLLGEDRLQCQTLQRALSLYEQCKSPEERYVAWFRSAILRCDTLSHPWGVPPNSRNLQHVLGLYKQLKSPEAGKLWILGTVCTLCCDLLADEIQKPAHSAPKCLSAKQCSLKDLTGAGLMWRRGMPSC